MSLIVQPAMSDIEFQGDAKCHSSYTEVSHFSAILAETAASGKSMTEAQVIRVPPFKAEPTDGQRRWSRICAIGGVVCIIFGVASCTWENWAARAHHDKAAVQPVAQTGLDGLKAKVAADAVEIMKRPDYSKTYSKLGKAQFNNANTLAPWAALAAAADNSCSKVNLVGISDATTPAKLVWFVDCEGGKRITIDQAGAEAARAQHDTKEGV